MKSRIECAGNVSGLPFSTINTVPAGDIVRPPSGQTRRFPRNRRNYHQFSFPKSTRSRVAVGYSSPPTPRVAKKKHRASSTSAAHWNLNVNLEKVRAHIAEREWREGVREGEGLGDPRSGAVELQRSECGVLFVSLAMSKTVVGSRPCLLSNSVRWTRISKAPKVVPPVLYVDVVL